MTRLKRIWRALWHKLYVLWRRIRGKPPGRGVGWIAESQGVVLHDGAFKDLPEHGKGEMHYPLGNGTYTDRDVRRLADMITGLPVYTDEELLEFVDRYLSPTARERARRGKKK